MRLRAELMGRSIDFQGQISGTREREREKEIAAGRRQ